MAKPKGLSDKKVIRIRELYSTGEHTQQQLAVKFKVSQSTICKIVNNYIHRHVPNIEMGGGAKVKLVIEYGD